MILSPVSLTEISGFELLSIYKVEPLNYLTVDPIKGLLSILGINENRS